MTSLDLPTPSSALAIGAHPDDIEFGAGATLTRWASDGCRVHQLVLTDGSKGSWDPDQNQADLVATRQREQRNASAALGIADVHFGAFVDGELRVETASVSYVCRVIREVRPAVVVAHDPWRRHRIHPDHRSAGEVCVDAIVAARDPLFFSDQRLRPHRPDHVLFFETDSVNHVERAESHHVDAKFRALLAHESQRETTMGITPDDPDSVELFRRRVDVAARSGGGRVGAPWGETFARRDDF